MNKNKTKQTQIKQGQSDKRSNHLSQFAGIRQNADYNRDSYKTTNNKTKTNLTWQQK